MFSIGFRFSTRSHGRRRKGVGEKNRERTKGYRINIQATNEEGAELARRLIGKRKLKMLSSGNNVLTFNNNACAELSEKRKRPRMANAQKTIEGAETLNSQDKETGVKVYHGGVG